MRRCWEIHPFFVVSILQMVRHGETNEAAEIAANELLILYDEIHAKKKTGGAEGAEGGGIGDGGGLLLLPTLRRQQELGYVVTTTANISLRNDHEQHLESSGPR